VVVAEDAEDVEHRSACFVLQRSLVAHHREEAIEGRFVFGTGGERFGELDAHFLVAGIGCEAVFEICQVVSAGGLQAGGRLQSIDLGVGDQLAEDDERFVGLTAIDEERREARARFGVVGLLFEHLAEDVLGGRAVVGQLGCAGLVDHEVELGREDALDPGAHRRLRLHAGERVGHCTIAKRHHHRDTLDSILRGKLLVGVDVNFDQFEGAVRVGSYLFKNRAEDPARLAPFGPEVDDHGHFTAPLQNLLREVRGVDVLHEIAGSGHRAKNTGGSPATVGGMESRPEAPFGQVLTAVITPFGDDGSIDYGTFWRLTRHLADHGSDGIVVGGTTGESPTLSKVEKVALYKAAVDAAGDRMAVIAGVGTYDTRESVDLAQRAAESGVDGIMAVTPYYSKPPQEGLFRHFTAIADAADLRVLLYNIPGRTCRIIEIDTLVRLAAHPRIVAVKDAVDDLDYTRREIEALPDGFAVYSGSDAMTREIVRMGGVGVVSVAAHLAGDSIKAMVDAAVRGDDDEADRLNELLGPLVDALFLEPNPMPLKAGLGLAWDSVGDPRLPLIPASDDTRATLERVLAALSGA
jgi:4-hydroxy-tetrahydrodipicolinate synthase